MDTDRIVTLTREESKNLAWVMKARATDSLCHPLQFLLQIGKRLVCIDGFRGHSIPCPKSLMNGKDESALRMLTPVSKVDKNEFVTIIRSENVKVPDVETPTRTPVTQVASTAVNPRYLRDALDGIGSMVVLRIWVDPEGNPTPITIETENGEKVAIVMPMHVSSNVLEPRRLHLVEVSENPAPEMETK